MTHVLNRRLQRTRTPFDVYGLYRSVCIRGTAVGGFPNPDTVYRASLSALLVMYVDRDVCSIASTRNFYNVMYGRSCGCTTFRTFTAYWQLLHTAQTHCYLRFMEYRLKVTSPPRNYPKIGYIRHEVPPTRDSQDVPFFFSETRRLRLAPRRAPKTEHDDRVPRNAQPLRKAHVHGHRHAAPEHVRDVLS